MKKYTRQDGTESGKNYRAANFANSRSKREHVQFVTFVSHRLRKLEIENVGIERIRGGKNILQDTRAHEEVERSALDVFSYICLGAERKYMIYMSIFVLLNTDQG